MTNIEKAFAELNNKVSMQARTITEEDIIAEATAMSKRGYIFGEEEQRLLKKYLTTSSGLLLLGGVGVGKTFFFKARMIPVLSMQRICERTLSEVRAALENHMNDEILIDDIGVEPEFNNYGVKINILEVIVEERLASNARTHFTTNLSVEALSNRYGVRVFDRIKELAKLITMSGDSKRKANGARIEPIDFFTPRVWEECRDRCLFWDDSSCRCTKKVSCEPRAVERCPYF